MLEVIPAKLVIVSGVLTGQVFSLQTANTTLGRDSSNDIGVPDAALSRLHCVFTFDVEGWTVRDVGSSNGTFVNGRQIQNHLLAEGDRIAAGGCLLLFIRDVSSLGPTLSLENDVPLAPTARLALDDAAYLDPNRSSPAGFHPREQGLKTLLAISTAIHAIRDERQLNRQLLDLLFEALPVEEGAIVRVVAGRELEIQAVRPVSAHGHVPINAATVHRAMSDGLGIVCAAAVRDDADTPRSGTAASDAAVLIVPLSVQGRPFGAINLTSRPGVAFTDDHLQLATAVARIAAVAIDDLRQFAALERETERLQADLHLTHQMLGNSQAMCQVFTRIDKVSRVATTVLITGETGTGKELAARAIHLSSARARRPFVAINCAALTETLLESELFGHERGAFTGAVTQKKGKLELADGGTVFLDEVGELAPALQSKLLRVLQEREMERVGGTQPIRVDLRLLSATSRDLPAAIASGTFRQDLYYRLNVVAIHMPALRERREDVELLARHFLGVYGPKSGRKVFAISSTAMQRMLDYEWPGNVRELENTIERACVLGSGDEILEEDLPEAVIDSVTARSAVTSEGLHACVLDAKRQAVIEAYRQAGGSYTDAAKLLGVHPNYLHRLIRNLRIKATLQDQEA